MAMPTPHCSPVTSAKAILNNPASSFWLINALQQALNRDPVDAAKDAAILSAILESRLSTMLPNSTK